MAFLCMSYVVWKVGNISSSDTIYDVWGWLILPTSTSSLLEAKISIGQFNLLLGSLELKSFLHVILFNSITFQA